MSVVLPDGYSDIPPGKVAAVVTCLEMLARPALRSERVPAPWELRHVARPDAGWYRALFARVGATQGLHDLQRCIRAAIVHVNDFRCQPKLGQDRSEAVVKCGQYCCLVVGGNDN